LKVNAITATWRSRVYFWIYIWWSKGNIKARSILYGSTRDRSHVQRMMTVWNEQCTLESLRINVTTILFGHLICYRLIRSNLKLSHHVNILSYNNQWTKHQWYIYHRTQKHCITSKIYRSQYFEHQNQQHYHWLTSDITQCSNIRVKELFSRSKFTFT